MHAAIRYANRHTLTGDNPSKHAFRNQSFPHCLAAELLSAELAASRDAGAGGAAFPVQRQMMPYAMVLLFSHITPSSI